MSFIFTKNDAKNHLKELINRFKNNYEFYNNSKYNESECRLEFIDGFLKDFGWDVQNLNGKSPNLKEVVVESYEQEFLENYLGISHDIINMYRHIWKTLNNRRTNRK